MANLEHLIILRQGKDVWNRWRDEHTHEAPDLRSVDLSDQDLSGFNFNKSLLAEANLKRAKLTDSDLRWANLWNVKLAEANLSMARLNGADLSDADIRGGVLRHVQLRWTSLWRVNFGQADLAAADLSGAVLVETDLTEAILDGSRVFGTSVWRLTGTPRSQANLIITPVDEPPIQVDNLEMAQFIYLLLNNRKIRDVIDTITSKVVLILGRFTPERKTVLDALRDELRNRDYLPVLFDFEQPPNQSTMETVSTLAYMARFVIADLTDAKSVLQELRGIVPSRPMLPVQPILLAAQAQPGMFDFFRMFPWVLETRYYSTPAELLANVAEWVITPAEQRRAAQRG